MFYFKKTHHELLKEVAEAEGIYLKINFFDKLEEIVEKLDNPLSTEDSIQLYVEVFEKTCQPNEIEIQIFKLLLNKNFTVEMDRSLEASSGPKYEPK